MRVIVHPGFPHSGAEFLRAALHTMPGPPPPGWFDARTEPALRNHARKLGNDLANFASTGNPKRRAGAVAALRHLLTQATDLGARTLILSDESLLGTGPAGYIAAGQKPLFHPRAGAVAELFEAELSGHDRQYLFTLRPQHVWLRQHYLDAIRQMRFDLSLTDFLDRLNAQGLAEYRFDRVVADWAQKCGPDRIVLLNSDLSTTAPDDCLRVIERLTDLPARLLNRPAAPIATEPTAGQVALARSLYEVGQDNPAIRLKQALVRDYRSDGADPAEGLTPEQERRIRDNFADDLSYDTGAGPYGRLTRPADIPPDLREVNAHFRIGGLDDRRADGRNVVYFWDQPLRMPAAFYGNVIHCAHHQPGWQVILLHDSDAPALLDGLDPVLAETYPRIRPPAARSDILRLAFLFRYGGWYIDADSSPIIALDGFDLSRPVMFRRDDMSRGDRFCANHCLFFDAGHEIPRRCLDRIADNIRQKRHLYEVEAFSGPGLLTHVLTEMEYPVAALYSYFTHFVQKDTGRFRSLRLPGSTSWSMEQFFGVLDDLPPDFSRLPMTLSPRTSAQLLVMLDKHPQPDILSGIASIRPRFLENRAFRDRYQTAFGKA
ncbi:MAG: glycosyltransferase [Paracoccus sp. (in: a-proteobacteria)]|nr:glycosyltransferase [Paracoccus sp. (in: a-proteobacteria)]